MQLSKVAILAALASLSLAGACKSDDASASKSPVQPGEAASPVPSSPGEEAVDPGAQTPQGGSDRAARHQERRAEMRQKYDTDGDGKLNRDERQAMRTAMLERRMSRLDGNGDGKISRQEAESARFGRRLLEDFDAADANRDSFVSRDELQTAMQTLRQKRREMRMQGGGEPAEPGAPAPPAPK
jgi:EF hand domain-containing protein